MHALALPKLKKFIGYNFPSLEAIRPFLEPTSTGSSSIWAKATAARLQCIVSVGYPEIVSTGDAAEDFDRGAVPASICYNSTITVSPKGDILAHYRKTHLYYTDETWASESGTKWLTTTLPLDLRSPSLSLNEGRSNGSHFQSMRTTFGICMDLNPHQFTAPWTLYELASFTLGSDTELLLLSMAWLTRQSAFELLDRPSDPDLETFSCWVERIVPLINNHKRETVIVFANRCGEEPKDARYAGSSWIGKAGFGKVKIWDIAGKAQETLLSVDTDQDVKYMLQTAKSRDSA